MVFKPHFTRSIICDRISDRILLIILYQIIYRIFDCFSLRYGSWVIKKHDIVKVGLKGELLDRCLNMDGIRSIIKIKSVFFFIASCIFENFVNSANFEIEIIFIQKCMSM